MQARADAPDVHAVLWRVPSRPALILSSSFQLKREYLVNIV